jgi:hypothetical protein
MDSRICIPHSFLIVVDDVGWWCGYDHRYKNGPSRSGIERYHCLEDYKAIIELGKSLNMRIKCGFVAGEWDRKNILAGVRNSNKHGSHWDNASRLHPDIDEAAHLINANNQYIELAMHGTMHMYWDDEGKMVPAEFYQRDEKGVYRMTPPSIVREHMDAFFEILVHNNLTTDILSFIPPCFIYTYSKDEDHLSHILAEYGIKFVSTPFASMQYTSSEKPVLAGVENGIITVDRTGDLTRWYELDAQTPEIVKKSYYGMHWPNFLNKDPEKNMETVNRWVKYFKGYIGRFDILPARNNMEGSSQALYKRFVDFKVLEDRVLFDFTELDAQGAAALTDYFHINAKNDLTLFADSSVSLKTERIYKDYTTYKLTRKKPYSKRSVISFKANGG